MKRFHLLRRALLALVIAVSLAISRTTAIAQPSDPAGDEPGVAELIHRVTETVTLLSKHDEGKAAPLFLAFWDFDGTILKGDCSEGLREGGREVYPGLAEVGIKAGLSGLYPAKGGFERFWADYTLMDDHAGHFVAYPYLAQIFRGVPEKDMLALSSHHFETVLRHYYFRSSIEIWEALRRLGVESHIITGSPDFFVKSAAPSLGLSASRVHGVRLEVRDGIITDRILYPITFGDGKREEVQRIVSDVAAKHPGRPIYLLAAFGNSFGSDGPFIRYVVGQHLPVGHPVGLMINGGNAPADYAHLFTELSFDATVQP